MVFSCRRGISGEPVYSDGMLRLQFGNWMENPLQDAEDIQLSKRCAQFDVVYKDIDVPNRCEYFGVVYIKGEALFLWTVGKYGPFEGRPKREVPPGIREPWLLDVLCKSKMISACASSLVGLQATNGYLRVDYTTDTDEGSVNSTMFFNERGGPVEAAIATADGSLGENRKAP